MKSLKYALMALLLITVYKKVVPSQEPIKTNKSTETEQIALSLKSDRQSAKHNAAAEKKHKKRFRSTVKKYNSDKKTATVDNIYVAVYEYKQAMTPPNITIPAMVPFGTITEKYSSSEQKLLGKKFNITTLWGIPVHGHRKPIKESERNLTIGYLWLDQDYIFGIAQMNDGKTFVGVIDDHQPNYFNTEKHRLGKTGPVWTWYSEEDFTDLKEKYGIKKPSSETVKEIGMAKINRQRYKLYGLEIPNLVEQTHALDSLSKHFVSTSQTIEPNAEDPMTSFNTLKRNLFFSKSDNQQPMYPLIYQLLTAKQSSTK